MWIKYYTPKTIDEAINLLGDMADRARIVAGATDLLLELERGQRPGIDVLIDISRIPGLDLISMDGDRIRLGPLVTHNHCAASKFIRKRAFTLARACWEVGAPQIRNRGTVAGNLITASPANDSIPALMALGAEVELRSRGGDRTVSLADFYTGVRKTVMRPDEILASISFPIPVENTRSTFIKLGLRQAQAIAVINAAVLIEMEDETVQRAVITLGSVAPTIIHAEKAESFLIGKTLSSEVIDHAAELAAQAAQPIDDLRSSAQYRRDMIRLCTSRGLRAIAQGEEQASYPEDPVLLWGPGERQIMQSRDDSTEHNGQEPIVTTINGKQFSFATGYRKSLLRLLREEGELIGTKEGCAEGECGACTVFLDGMAVMACLVPAPRAHGAEIITIEGLAGDEELHPLQEAFIEAAAVQCGYCTPGFIMSGVKLLEEKTTPELFDIQQAISGNLCRCTGYYKIIHAIEMAAESGER
jgi:xanthine dehydrogenase iron-sulfur cluster and FAD-binding subunit A